MPSFYRTENSLTMIKAAFIAFLSEKRFSLKKLCVYADSVNAEKGSVNHPHLREGDYWVIDEMKL